MDPGVSRAVSTVLADTRFLSPANRHQHYFWVDPNLNSAEFPLHRPNCQRGGGCYNFGKLISSCTRCHNIQLKYYFSALAWPQRSRQPVVRRPWEGKALRSLQYEWMERFTLLCIDIEVKPKHMKK